MSNSNITLVLSNTRVDTRRDPICSLCEMLNSNLEHKWIQDLTLWAEDGSQCDYTGDLDWVSKIT